MLLWKVSCSWMPTGAAQEAENPLGFLTAAVWRVSNPAFLLKETVSLGKREERWFESEPSLCQSCSPACWAWLQEEMKPPWAGRWGLRDSKLFVKAARSTQCLGGCFWEAYSNTESVALLGAAFGAGDHSFISKNVFFLILFFAVDLIFKLVWILCYM